MIRKNIFIALIMSSLTISCTSKTTESTTTTSDSTDIKNAVQKPENTADTFCFLKAENQDSTTISLTILGNKISGQMHWNPYQKDGALGSLAGTKNAAGEFELLYDYVIEGSKQTETKIMKIENGKLMIKTGPLEDPKYDGNLRYKDASKAIYSEILTGVDCKE